MASSPSSPAPRRAALKTLLGASAAVLALGAGLAWWGTRRPVAALARQQCEGGSMTRKVLVAYATRAGSTGEIGAAIAKQLCAEGFDAELREVSSVNGLDGYAAVVLGSAVRYGDWLARDARLHARQRCRAAFFEKMVVKMIGSPEGDFRDWAAIGAWAQSLVPLFKPAA